MKPMQKITTGRCIAAVAPTVMATLAALALGGCAVGPDFKKPDAPAVQRYMPEPPASGTAAAETAAGNAQSFADGQDIPAQWWAVFHSEALNELIAAALRNNPDLQAAEAALRATQEGAAAQRGAYFPSVDAHLAPTRQSIAPDLASPADLGNRIYTLHTAQLNISYVPDVFGGNRRQVESLDAQTQAQRFQREAVYLTLTSNLVAAAIQEASLREQITATRAVIALAARQLEMIRKQKALGQLAAADVAAQETVLAQAQASLPPLEKQLAQQRHLLAVLAGRFPSEDISARFELSSFTLPQELPLSLPSRLVEQRPDIRAAEAQWHAASAQVGVAIANRLPNITLTGSVGSSALELSKLFSGTGFWNIGADLAQSVFDGGTLRHRQRAAEAAYEQAAAQYRGTVLVAFQNVADTLQAIQSDASTLAAATVAERAAGNSLAIARRQWELGASSIVPVLIAEQAHQQTAIALVQAQASRYTDTAALFQALGGGWWNRKDAASVAALGVAE
ncbi:efflux transporter outer membrane subunit [Undibacterium sp.]|jgi:NodT family efflux transporter outer membrane factor (OMF) lipoprotein|uniref:efflux transporter outer membrane subunit n=1 Tax=Undibacterium sp. TaxID=1914977 RepID=UPI002BC4B947|nr:efflux transporter outer membrane subunit [Undibacterium sp.]HTD03022.1 efflux transporter outer membrane subunit [Undibacterium sp.]